MVIWSVSTSRIFDRCQRQYFFSQLMAWHKTNDPLRQRAYMLKRIQQFNWWPGSVVHTAIQRWILSAIEKQRWPSPGQVVAQARDLALQQFSFSQDAGYSGVSKSEAEDDQCVLAPHYFGEPLRQEALERTLATIEVALHNLLNDERMRHFLLGRQWYRWEYVLTHKIEGVTVRAVPDLMMFAVGSSGLDIVDWKVATSASSYHFQVAVYALAARETAWLANYARNELTGYVVNLLDPAPGAALDDPYRVDDRVLTTTVNVIYESIERIRALTGDRHYHQLDIGQFEYANSPGTCAFCNWRRLCVELGDGSPAESLSNIEPKPTQLELPLG